MRLQPTLFRATICAALASASLPASAQTSGAAAPAATQIKIGFVNTERILRDAVPAVRAQKKIEAEFKKRDDELAKIADQLKRMQEELDKNSRSLLRRWVSLIVTEFLSSSSCMRFS